MWRSGASVLLLHARLQWLASSPPTSLVDRRSAMVGGISIGVHVGGGVRVGIYRVVEGMGITNFTMVVPTVQSSRAPLESHRRGRVGGKLWSAIDGGDVDSSLLEVGQRWGHVWRHVSPRE